LRPPEGTPPSGLHGACERLEVSGWDLEGEAVSGADKFEMPPASGMVATPCWYAFRTRSRHEKRANQQLEEAGIESFLPVAHHLRQWSDRRKNVELPLFPGYGFVRIDYLSSDRIRVLGVHGIVNLVGCRGSGTPIPDQQIQALRNLMVQKARCEPHPYPPIGRTVRIRGGALDGVQGILTEHREDRSLVISLEAIQRSVSIRIEGYDLEVL
jgi:transcription antitermination factor NusG